MLKELREKLQMSKKEFAPLMGLQSTEIGRLEKQGSNLTRLQKTLIRAINLMYDKSVDGQGVTLFRDYLIKCNQEEERTLTLHQERIIAEMQNNPTVWPNRIVSAVTVIESDTPNYAQVQVDYIGHGSEHYLIGREGGILQIKKRQDCKGFYNLPLRKWWHQNKK